MSKTSQVNEIKFTRRSFIKGATAVGATAALYGCGSSSDTEYVYADNPGTGDDDTTVQAPVETYFGSGGHNCGGRCVTRAEVSKGRIQRFLTDESKYASDGTYLDPESRNFPQTRACSRCRSYRYRIYHAGRLMYPLKQTKKRGDLSGFKRITWEQALKEIATKHKAVVDKYSSDGIYSIYAWGAATGTYQGASGGPLGAGGAGGSGGAALRYMGGAQGSYFGSYSTHQYRYFGEAYTGIDASAVTGNSVAVYTNNVVLWGDNSLSTRNPLSYGIIRSLEDMKKRNPDAKVYFIGPEFVDGGITTADEWVVAKPFTDPALVAGMVYHMLDNTFDLTTGVLKSNPWLDLDYLDTLVYGFFDAPQYGLTEATGVIDASSAHAGDRVIPAVPAGRSYCSWVLGNNNNAKAYSQLGAATNYNAAQIAAGSDMKRWAPCSYTATAGSATVYKTKKDYKTPKTPEWASAITGVPVEAIKRLAEVYVKGGPVTSTWSGGQQKQADGINNLFAVQALHVITKNVGTLGAGFVWNISTSNTADPKALNPSPTRSFTGFINNQKQEASCTAWHTIIKQTYANELKTAGYRAKYIPNWPAANSGTITTGDGDVFWDDGGTKAFVQWDRNSDGTIKTLTTTEGGKTRTYFQWKTDGAGKPIFSGIRLMYNTGGNIFINQHENSNDSREMLEYLPLNDYTDPDSFCLVSFDNFLSPTPRWSDYVLPAATFWEQQDVITPTKGSSFYTPQVATPPGESKPTWNFAQELLKAYENVAPEAAGAEKDFSGGTSGQTVEAIYKKAFNAATTDSTSPFYQMTWDEYIKKPYLPAKPNEYAMPSLATKSVIDAYKALSASGKMSAFVKTSRKVATNEWNQGGYGNEYDNIEDAPKSSFKYHIFSPVFVWQYENRFSKWHGYLPLEKRGQPHKDIEGDRIVVEIPLYYAYEDYFMEAYGSNPSKLNGLQFLLTTSHDRYRSHSSMAESPLMRELTHRVPGKGADGKYKQANDWNDYSMAPDQAAQVNEPSVSPVLNRTINADGTVSAANKEIASYSEIWMNETDGKEMGLEDGDLVQVENPIGAVRCVARLTKRCSRGYVGLHQGCWYDPRPLANSYNHDFVDVGGNCNTLMASQPSRVDHGNGQQSAMVKIFKVTDY